jgi:hypothetical protein
MAEDTMLNAEMMADLLWHCRCAAANLGFEPLPVKLWLKTP